MAAVPPKTDIACAMKLLDMHGERAERPFSLRRWQGDSICLER